ncbi:MAG: hypothetical protein IJX42_07070 [Oscillospiraceae bacterium]|nr:hypothetical protein [Oscillospiraceae bacterium]
MEKTMKYVSIIVFFLTLGTFMFMTIFLPKSDFSEAENRYLEEFPEISAEEIFNNDKDNRFMSKLDSYVSDHFAMRTSLITVKTKSDMLIGSKMTNGVLLLDDRYVEPITEFKKDTVDKSVNAINHLAEVSGKPVFVMLVPTAAGIYSEEIPEYYENIDQKKAIDDIYYSLSDKVTTLNIYPKLYSSRDRYIYYKNDHHWTSYGAYLCYNAAIRKMGYNPVEYNNYNVQPMSDKFYGTYYSKALYDGYGADTIDKYSTKGVNVTEVAIKTGSETLIYDTMYFNEYLGKKDKYSYYLNNAMYPVVDIKTDYAEENKILVIKDSYAQCFVPFLTQHYSQITMVDMRSVLLLNSVVDVKDYDQILVLYNYGGFIQDENLKKLQLVR